MEQDLTKDIQPEKEKPQYIVIKEYIPPQFYDSNMAIGRRAANVRANNRTLKTLQRWGNKDIKIFTKTRGSQEQFQKVDLYKFMGDIILPEFDINKEWKSKKDTGIRRKPIRRKVYTAHPAREKEGAGPPACRQSRKGLTRLHSLSSYNDGKTKRPRTSSGNNQLDGRPEMSMQDTGRKAVKSGTEWSGW